MKQKIVLITGGTGGIGKHTAIGLAKLGARVVVTGRDRERGEAGVAEIQSASGNAEVYLLLSDLSSLAGVRQLAQDFQAQYRQLDVLINNAGLLTLTKQITPDGLEADFAVNVVTPYLLTHLLLPQLKASPSARVVNLNGGLPLGGIDLQNMQAEKNFVGLPTYSHSKMLMTAMSLEFARRLQGTPVSVNVVYPGGASTAMTGAMRQDTLPVWMRPFWPIFKGLMQKNDGGKSAARAAQSSIYAASSPDMNGVSGVSLGTNSKRAKVSASILLHSNQSAIWQTLERITGQFGVASTSPAGTVLGLA